MGIANELSEVDDAAESIAEPVQIFNYAGEFVFGVWCANDSVSKDLGSTEDAFG